MMLYIDVRWGNHMLLIQSSPLRVVLNGKNEHQSDKSPKFTKIDPTRNFESLKMVSTMNESRTNRPPNTSLNDHQ